MLKDKKILYLGISSKFIHTNLAGWYLEEYLISKDIKISSFHTNVNVDIEKNIAEILKYEPELILCSVYIFNLEYVKKIFLRLKEKIENIKIAVGGPEVDDDFDADYILIGEGEKSLFKMLTEENPSKINYEIIETNLDNIPSPYTEERLSSLKNKLIYYESSRGCPFKCSYCMAGLTKGVRYFSLERVFTDLKRIAKVGGKVVKFTDRTSNENPIRFQQILKFIKDSFNDICFHFEIGVELLTEDNLAVIKNMPKGLIQFEIGVQTLNRDTQKAINRPFNEKKFIDNLTSLLENDNVHIHLDLIFGLPKENLLSFKNSFNNVFNFRPQQLQVGFLKFLKYAPIKDYPYGQKYGDMPPYEVISTDDVSVEDKKEVKYVDLAVDKFYNSQKYHYSINYLLKRFPTPYALFLEMGKFFYDNDFTSQNKTLYKFFIFMGKDEVALDILKFDYLSTNNSRILPEFMKRPYINKIMNKDVNYYKSEFLYYADGQKGFHTVTFDYRLKDKVNGRYSFIIDRQLLSK